MKATQKFAIMSMDTSTSFCIKSPDRTKQTSKTNEILKLKVLKLKVLKLKVLKLIVLKLKVTNIFVHF